MCVCRYFNVSAGTADLEFHGIVSVSDVGSTEATFSLEYIYDFAAVDAPAMQFSQTCQLILGLKRCGADPIGVECKYRQQTC